MEKILEVQKNKSEDQNLVGEWLSNCQAEKRPCVIIYYDGDDAYISANIMGLVTSHEPKLEVDQSTINKCFLNLSLAYTENPKNYWNHNGMYFTFDNIPKDRANAVAEEIYHTLEKLITQNHC